MKPAAPVTRTCMPLEAPIGQMRGDFGGLECRLYVDDDAVVFELGEECRLVAQEFAMRNGEDEGVEVPQAVQSGECDVVLVNDVFGAGARIDDRGGDAEGF